MHRILHVGLPKCLSTSLQALFRAEPGAHFIGVGPSKHVHPDVLHAVQTQVLRTQAPYYDAGLVGAVFQRELDRARSAGAQAAVLSDEALPVTVGQGLGSVSFGDRLLRLRDVLGEDTGVLLVLRHPLQLLRSLYRYWVVHYGLALNYRLYVQHLLVKGAASHLALLDYWALAQQTRLVFPALRIVLFEELVERPETLRGAMGALGLEVAGALGKENAGEPEAVVAEMLRLNRGATLAAAPHDFNDYTPIEMRQLQAAPTLYGELLGEATRRITLHQAQLLAARSMAQTSGAELDEELGDSERDLLNERVATSNGLLRRDFGVDLERYGYPL